MRGYNDFDRLDSLSTHFVYSDEIDFDVLARIKNYVAARQVRFVYIDGIKVISEGVDLCNAIGVAANTKHKPYVASAWWPLCDDLIAMSYGSGGLLVIIDNSRPLIAAREREVLKFAEIFQIQSHHWVNQGKTCDLYFQMDSVEGLKFSLPGISS